jgi:hypothetical protein
MKAYGRLKVARRTFIKQRIEHLLERIIEVFFPFHLLFTVRLMLVCFFVECVGGIDYV